MNQQLADMLAEMAEIYDLYGEGYRSTAYSKAAKRVAAYNGPLADIPRAGFGRDIYAKIQEYISTSQIAVLSDLRAGDVETWRAFSKILGVGPKTIEEWVDKGIKTLHDLRRATLEGSVKLNPMQSYGLLYYDDLSQKIPRAEVTELSAHFMRLAIQIDPDVIYTVAGSYRRMAPSSGDIDILVSNERQFNPDFLGRFQELLSEDPRYIATIVQGVERVTFLYKSPISHVVRQIDVLNISYTSYWTAILYFTGSWDFNQAMRGWAKKHGYRLSQKGLACGGLDIPVASEAEIFRVLGLEYVEPQQRTDDTAVRSIK